MDFRRQATHTQSHRQRAASVCKDGEKGWRGFHILQFVLLLPVTMSLRSKAQIMQFACNFCIRRDWTNETKRMNWIQFVFAICHQSNHSNNAAKNCIVVLWRKTHFHTSQPIRHEKPNPYICQSVCIYFPNTWEFITMPNVQNYTSFCK